MKHFLCVHFGHPNHHNSNLSERLSRWSWPYIREYYVAEAQIHDCTMPTVVLKQ